MELWIIGFILTGHFVADFVCQSHWMASNKSKRWDALTLHVVVYSIVMTSFMFPVFLSNVFGLIAFFVVTFITHFITDAITSRITSWLWHRAKIHDFFVVIGFDQLIHYATLIGTVYYLT